LFFRNQLRFQSDPHILTFAELKLHKIPSVQLRSIKNTLFLTTVERKITMIFTPDHGFPVHLVAPKHNSIHFDPQYSIPKREFPLPHKFDEKQSLRDIPNYVSRALMIVTMIKLTDANWRHLWRIIASHRRQSTDNTEEGIAQ